MRRQTEPTGATGLRRRSTARAPRRPKRAPYTHTATSRPPSNALDALVSRWAYNPAPVGARCPGWAIRLASSLIASPKGHPSEADPKATIAIATRPTVQAARDAQAGTLAVPNSGRDECDEAKTLPEDGEGPEAGRCEGEFLNDDRVTEALQVGGDQLSGSDSFGGSGFPR